ncbi:MAG: hypothetical protein C5B60_01100 [Chloroflexi bacterium]|nr:MAG: hypothetical protein C5B60_01100 [Chloroflexota bacterium]
MLWRQGDVLIESIAAIPLEAELREGSPILAYGEATGHSHRVEAPENAQVWVLYGQLYLKLLETATVVHDEHGPITLPAGAYRVWQQREYTPQDVHAIRD